jgi:CRISPR/Cas system-associated exonuclease Cas4 (RecB family)
MKPIKKIEINIPKINLEDITPVERKGYISASQLDRFMTCPHSYEISYYRGIKTEGNKFTEFGSGVHEALEKFYSEDAYNQIDPKHFGYLNAVQRWLDKNDDEIIATEIEMEFKLGKWTIYGFVDAITKKGYIIDYKITSAPSRYKSGLHYQLPLYILGMEAMGYGALKPAYILLKRDSDFNFVGNKGGEVDFYSPNIPKKRLKKIETMILSVLENMDRDWESGVFPYKTADHCKMCFVRQHCEFYSGGF